MEAAGTWAHMVPEARLDGLQRLRLVRRWRVGPDRQTRTMSPASIAGLPPSSAIMIWAVPPAPSAS